MSASMIQYDVEKKNFSKRIAEILKGIEKIELQTELFQNILKGLESGEIRVVEPDTWEVHSWVKEAILLMFRAFGVRQIEQHWCDRFGLIETEQVMARHVRLVPGCFVRQGVFLDKGVIVMPGAFVNIGAWVGQGTMVDSGSTIGSCAYIGSHCHIASNVTIGGVLEPVHEKPVIIEEGTFIGAGCHIVEHVHIGKGAVLGAGVILSGSTKIVHRQTQEIAHGVIPDGAVVVPGVHEGLSCAVIIKTVDDSTRKKTSLNDLLRP